MSKKLLAALLLTVLLVFAAPVPDAGAANTVRVSLPDFPVSLNSLEFSSDYSKYPILVYTEITYFPMTYSDCRLLGLQTAWTAEAGLSIEKNSRPISDYTREVVTVKNQKTQTAQIAAGKIQVNGKTIDNSREPYPLLVFRDVTYFPLTWRFAVEEFGWTYHFGDYGLLINNLSTRLECTETWTETEAFFEEWGSLMGTGNMNLFCTFGAAASDENRSPKGSVRLYNITGADIKIEPREGEDWEYQLYQLINGQEELVYTKVFPFYTGELKARQYVAWGISGMDSECRLQEGAAYRAVFVHPRYLLFSLGGGVISEPMDGDGYALDYSVEFTAD